MKMNTKYCTETGYGEGRIRYERNVAAMAMAWASVRASERASERMNVREMEKYRSSRSRRAMEKSTGNGKKTEEEEVEERKKRKTSIIFIMILQYTRSIYSIILCDNLNEKLLRAGLLDSFVK